MNEHRVINTVHPSNSPYLVLVGSHLPCTVHGLHCYRWGEQRWRLEGTAQTEALQRTQNAAVCQHPPVTRFSQLGGGCFSLTQLTVSPPTGGERLEGTVGGSGCAGDKEFISQQGRSVGRAAGLDDSGRGHFFNELLQLAACQSLIIAIHLIRIVRSTFLISS